MVELYVFDYEETALERELQNADIEYQLCLDIGNYGLKPPYLVVDGVPLDFNRSLKWIKECGKHE